MDSKSRGKTGWCCRARWHWLKEQAKVDLIDSVRIFSQDYHAGTVEFAEAAKKIFTPEQLEQILK